MYDYTFKPDSCDEQTQNAAKALSDSILIRLWKFIKEFKEEDIREYRYYFSPLSYCLNIIPPPADLLDILTHILLAVLKIVKSKSEEARKNLNY